MISPHRQLAQGLALLILLGSVWLLYLPGLSGPMLLDDFPVLSHYLELDAVALGDGSKTFLPEGVGLLGRSLAEASFLLDGVLHGNDLTAWKAENALLHLVCGVVLFGFARRIAAKVGHGDALAWVAAALWLLHPLHVSTVLYTTQRMTELSALFVLLGLYCYAVGRDRFGVAPRRAVPWLMSSYFVCLPLGALSKENALLLPGFLFLLEVLIYRFRAGTGRSRELVWLHGVVLGLGGVAAVVYLAGHFEALVLADYAGRPFTLGERLLSEPRVLFAYLGMLLVPVQRAMGFFHDDVLVSHSLLVPWTTLPALLGTAALLTAAWLLRRRWPLVAFGILFFYCGHLMESTFLPLELMFEHRNYLPAVGVSLALADLTTRVPVGRAFKAGLIAVYLVVLAAVLALRVEVWRSPESLWTYAYAAHPNSPTVALETAFRSSAQGDFLSALTLLGRFDDDGFRVARLYLGCQLLGGLEPGQLVSVTEGWRGYTDERAAGALVNLANLGLDETCTIPDAAMAALLERALSVPVHSVTRSVQLLLFLAHYRHRGGDLEGALASLEQAVTVKKNYPVPLFLAARWLAEEGATMRAEEYLDRARDAAPESGRDYAALDADVVALLHAARGPAK